MNSIDDTQPSKRSLAHVGCTEQRIRFKEVQLKEKARPGPTPSESRQAELSEEVASMYVDPEPDKIASAATPSGALGTTGPAPPRKRKKRSRKGKERAVEVDEEDAMDTT